MFLKGDRALSKLITLLISNKKEFFFKFLQKIWWIINKAKDLDTNKKKLHTQQKWAEETGREKSERERERGTVILKRRASLVLPYKPEWPTA